MTEDDARKIAMLVVRYGEACANGNDDADEELYDQIVTRLSALARQPPPGVLDALRTAEAALSDIGDATREPGDDLAWCERRAAQALPQVRAALAAEPPQPENKPDAPWRDHPAAIDAKALATAQEIALMWGAGPLPVRIPDTGRRHRCDGVGCAGNEPASQHRAATPKRESATSVCEASFAAQASERNDHRRASPKSAARGGQGGV